MADRPWRDLIDDPETGRLDIDGVQDRCFALWHAVAGAPVPVGVERLFLVVKACRPDPALRDPHSPFEADAAEVRQAAAVAGRLLAGG